MKRAQPFVERDDGVGQFAMHGIANTAQRKASGGIEPGPGFAGARARKASLQQFRFHTVSLEGVDLLDLYGFLDKEVLNTFELLIGISDSSQRTTGGVAYSIDCTS